MRFADALCGMVVNNGANFAFLADLVEGSVCPLCLRDHVWVPLRIFHPQRKQPTHFHRSYHTNTVTCALFWSDTSLSEGLGQSRYFAVGLIYGGLPATIYGFFLGTHARAQQTWHNGSHVMEQSTLRRATNFCEKSYQTILAFGCPTSVFTGPVQT